MVLQRQGDVFSDAEMVQQTATIKYHPDPQPNTEQLMLETGDDLFAKEAVLTLGQGQNASSSADEVAFAGAVQSPDGPIIAFAHGPVKVLEDKALLIDERIDSRIV